MEYKKMTDAQSRCLDKFRIKHSGHESMYTASTLIRLAIAIRECDDMKASEDTIEALRKCICKESMEPMTLRELLLVDLWRTRNID